VKSDHLKELACKLFHLDPLNTSVIDVRTNSVLDDKLMTELVMNPAVTEVYTRLGAGDGMIRVMFRLLSVSKPRTDLIPLDLFLPKNTMEDVLRLFASRQEALCQALGFTGLVLVRNDGRELDVDHSTLLEAMPQNEEKDTIVLNIAPSEEMQDVNIVDTSSPEQPQRSMDIKLPISTTAATITSICAGEWGFNPEKCSLQVVTTDGSVTLVPEATIQAALSGGLSEFLTTAQVGSLPLLFRFFEPTSLVFWNNGSDPVDLLICDGLLTEHVKKTAADTLQIKEDISQYSIVQHGSGHLITGDKIDVTRDGKDFELVPTSSLTTVVAPMEDPNMPPASVKYYAETESSIMTVGEFIAAVPKPQPDSKLVLFVDGIEAASTLPVSSLGGTVVVVDVQHTKMLLVNVTVTIEKRSDAKCQFKADCTVHAQDIRVHAAKLLGMENSADALLADSEGCIIDDMCAMSDMESYDFVLLE